MDATLLHPPRLGRLEALRSLRPRRAHTRGPAPAGDRGVGVGRRQRSRRALHADRLAEISQRMPAVFIV